MGVPRGKKYVFWLKKNSNNNLSEFRQIAFETPLNDGSKVMALKDMSLHCQRKREALASLGKRCSVFAVFLMETAVI